jgi:archaetidylinositol phosphate synthase
MTPPTGPGPGRTDAGGAPQHERTSQFLLAPLERRVLPRIARALPARVMPDHLTALGLLASTLIAAAYLLSRRDEAWLWAASALLVVQWFGDSLDGTLARVRRTERPRYGYYLDHITDAYSTSIIGLGLGLSDFMLTAVALAVVVVYLMMSINVYLETYVFGEFRFSYGRLGPTEVRVILILLNTVALLWRPVLFEVGGIPVTGFDIAGTAAALAMLVLLLGRVASNLRTLGRLEPPGRPRTE